MRQFREEGIDIGRKAKLLEIVQKMLAKGQTICEAADLLGEDETIIRKLVDQEGLL